MAKVVSQPIDYMEKCIPLLSQTLTHLYWGFYFYINCNSCRNHGIHGYSLLSQSKQNWLCVVNHHNSMSGAVIFVAAEKHQSSPPHQFFLSDTAFQIWYAEPKIPTDLCNILVQQTWMSFKTDYMWPPKSHQCFSLSTVHLLNLTPFDIEKTGICSAGMTDLNTISGTANLNVI